MYKFASVLKIVLWSIVAVIVLSLMITIAFGNFYWKGWDEEHMGEWQVLTDKTYSAIEVNSIEIIGSSEDIRVMKSTDGQFRVYETYRIMGLSNNTIEPCNVTVNAGVFRVDRSTSSWFENWVVFGWREHKIDIYLPDMVWDEYTAKLSSGSFSNADISAKNITIDCSSGDITAENISASESLVFKISSGNINVSSSSSKKCEVKVLSGNFKIGSLESDELNVNLSSGVIEIDGSFKGVTSKVSSGELLLSSSILPDKVDLRISSGEADLRLPRGSQFTIDYQKSSGDIHSTFNHSFSGSSGKTGTVDPIYTVKLSSGSVGFID